MNILANAPDIIGVAVTTGLFDHLFLPKLRHASVVCNFITSPGDRRDKTSYRSIIQGGAPAIRELSQDDPPL